MHEAVVRWALARGERVPDAVLADHPGIRHAQPALPVVGVPWGDRPEHELTRIQLLCARKGLRLMANPKQAESIVRTGRVPASMAKVFWSKRDRGEYVRYTSTDVAPWPRAVRLTTDVGSMSFRVRDQKIMGFGEEIAETAARVLGDVFVLVPGWTDWEPHLRSIIGHRERPRLFEEVHEIVQGSYIPVGTQILMHLGGQRVSIAAA